MVEHWNVDSYVPFPIGGSDFRFAMQLSETVKTFSNLNERLIGVVK